MGDSIYMAQIDVINWFNFDDSLFADCPKDIISYLYLLQDSMFDTFNEYINDLENASRIEYSAYQTAIENFNTLLDSYPDSSCKSTMESWFDPETLRKTYLTCASNIAKSAQTFSKIIMLFLPDFVKNCNTRNV